MTTNLPPDPAAGPTNGPEGTGTTTTGPTGPTGPAPLPLADTFDRIRAAGLVRPDEGRWGAGVCAGIAHRTGIDVALVRGLFVLVALFGGGALLVYGLMWLFMPHPDGRIHAQEVLRGVVTAGFVGSVLAVLAGVPSSNGFAWSNGGWGFHPGGIGILVVVGLVIWLATQRRGHQGPGGWGPGGPGGTPPYQAGPSGPSSTGSTTPPAASGTPSAPAAPSTWGTPGNPPQGSGSDGPSSGTTWATSATTGWAPPAAPPPVRPVPAPAPDLTRPSHGLTRATLGAALVGGAAVALLDRAGADIPMPFAVGAAVVLGIIALGILAAGLSGRRSGGLAPIAWLVAIVAVNAVAIGNVDTRAGDVTWRPASVSAAEAGLDRGAGDLRVDLTDPAMRAGATAGDPVDLSVSVGAGRIVLVVPTGTATRVDAQVGLGEINDRVARSTQGGGPGENRQFVVGTGEVTVVVHAKVGLGEVLVVPQGSTVGLAATTAPTTTPTTTSATSTEALR